MLVVDCSIRVFKIFCYKQWQIIMGTWYIPSKNGPNSSMNLQKKLGFLSALLPQNLMPSYSTIHEHVWMVCCMDGTVLTYWAYCIQHTCICLLYTVDDWVQEFSIGSQPMTGM